MFLLLKLYSGGLNLVSFELNTHILPKLTYFSIALRYVITDHGVNNYSKYQHAIIIKGRFIYNELFLTHKLSQNLLIFCPHLTSS